MPSGTVTFTVRHSIAANICFRVDVDSETLLVFRHLNIIDVRAILFTISSHISTGYALTIADRVHRPIIYVHFLLT
jgi:hypothetical protein